MEKIEKLITFFTNLVSLARNDNGYNNKELFGKQNARHFS